MKYCKKVALGLIWIIGVYFAFIFFSRQGGYKLIQELPQISILQYIKYGCHDRTHEEDVKILSSPELNPVLLAPLTKTDLRIWSFKSRVQCPELNISDIGKERRNLKINCGNGGPCIYFEVTSSRNVTSFSFGDVCVSDIIEKYCNDGKPVPNVLHYIWYGKVEVKYHHLLSFMSAVRYMKPCLIIFHGERLPYGKYWDYFTSKYYKLLHLKRPLVISVHGRTLSYPEHGADVMRIEALQRYGGLYIDSDTVILRSVDKLRNYNFTMSHEYPDTLGNQFIMARKGAKFLDLWYAEYKNYKAWNWGHNSLHVPYQIAKKNPGLIRIEGDKFCRPNFYNRTYIFNTNFNWAINYAMHLFMRMYKKKTNEFMIRKLNTTFGAVSRHVLFGNKELCL